MGTTLIGVWHENALYINVKNYKYIYIYVFLQMDNDMCTHAKFVAFTHIRHDEDSNTDLKMQVAI